MGLSHYTLYTFIYTYFLCNISIRIDVILHTHTYTHTRKTYNSAFSRQTLNELDSRLWVIAITIKEWLGQIWPCDFIFIIRITMYSSVESHQTDNCLIVIKICVFPQKNYLSSRQSNLSIHTNHCETTLSTLSPRSRASHTEPGVY